MYIEDENKGLYIWNYSYKVFSKKTGREIKASNSVRELMRKLDNKSYEICNKEIAKLDVGIKLNGAEFIEKGTPEYEYAVKEI